MVFRSLCDSLPRAPRAKRRKLAGGHAGLISGRIKSGFVSCPRARISWMIVLVSIWVLIILLVAGGDERRGRMSGRTDGRKNLGSEARVANNCYGVGSAFCNPAGGINRILRIFSRGYTDPRDILNFRFKFAIILARRRARSSIRNSTADGNRTRKLRTRRALECLTRGNVSALCVCNNVRSIRIVSLIAYADKKCINIPWKSRERANVYL